MKRILYMVYLLNESSQSYGFIAEMETALLPYYQNNSIFVNNISLINEC